MSPKPDEDGANSTPTIKLSLFVFRRCKNVADLRTRRAIYRRPVSKCLPPEHDRTGSYTFTILNRLAAMRAVIYVLLGA
jgi:hypothetical protein